MRDSSLDDFLSDPDEGSGEDGADASEGEAGDDPEAEHPEPEPESDGEIESEPEPDDEAGDESELEPDTGEADKSEEEEGPPSTAEVEPARSTYAWSPEGEPCEACGERVEERWESADGLVCLGCKEW